MKNNLFTVTLNDQNTIIEKTAAGFNTAAGFISFDELLTVEKTRSNGKKDVFYYSINYRPEISKADYNFFKALPDHAKSRILHAAADTVILTAAGLYRFENVDPEKVNAFYNELKKEKFFQAKKEKAARIIENIKAGKTLNNSDYLFIKECFNDSITIGSGKLKGINSISTAVFLNNRCMKNAKNKAWICSKCYALKFAGMRSDLSRKLELNTVLYTNCILPAELLPEINAAFFRFESFGDLNNDMQQINYFNICRKNSRVSFAQWSKNPDITAAAIAAGNEKPANLNYIYSSPLLNNVAPENVKGRYSFIDKYFTVYDPQTINKDGVKVNCLGAAAGGCISCLNCYTKNNIQLINEKLK